MTGDSASVRSAALASGPSRFIWDITYACPLRCVHCYSESGRRPSRQLRPGDALRVVDTLIAAAPRAIVISGGEPLLVSGLLDIAERISRAGIGLVVYTGGWPLNRGMAEELARLGAQVTVSLDGATTEVHDRIRGRVGSFQRALDALTVLDRVAAGAPLSFGIDYTVIRGNLAQVQQFCRDVPARFPRLESVTFGVAVPSGLANRPDFADRELLTDDQLRELTRPSFRRHLGDLAPDSVSVSVTDNRLLQMHPDQIAAGQFFRTLQLEPDGAVRAMPMYEGTVGNVLVDPIDVLWERAVRRWLDPWVTETLAPVTTMRDWARAALAIDQRFGSAEVRARVQSRPPADRAA